MHRPGINYLRRIRCVTVGTVQIAPPLPNKIRRAQSFSGPAFFVGNEQVLNLHSRLVAQFIPWPAQSADKRRRAAPRSSCPRYQEKCAGAFSVPANVSSDVGFQSMADNRFRPRHKEFGAELLVLVASAGGGGCNSTILGSLCLSDNLPVISSIICAHK